MQTIQCYKTIDGQIFEDLDLAEEHEKALRYRNAVQQLAESVATDLEGREAITNLFFEHTEEAREVLAMLD